MLSLEGALQVWSGEWKSRATARPMLQLAVMRPQPKMANMPIFERRSTSILRNAMNGIVAHEKSTMQLMPFNQVVRCVLNKLITVAARTGPDSQDVVIFGLAHALPGIVGIVGAP